MNFRRWLGFLIVMALVTGCAKSVKVKSGAMDDKEVIAVKTVPVASTDFWVQLKLSGSTESKQDVLISASQGGYVEALYADVGDWVNQGQVLAEISAAMAKAQYTAASSAMTAAKSSYDRQIALNTQGLTSAQLLEGAKAQYEGARAQLEVAQVNLDHSVIRAPFSGRVASRYPKRYEMTAPGSPVFNLVDASQLKVTVGVNESDIGHIRMGQVVTVNIQSIGRDFLGRVTRVGIKADAMHHTFPVQIVFDNTGLVAPSGAVADVYLDTAKYTNVVAVRQDYIIQEDEDNYVFVASGNRAVKRKVQIGPRGSGDQFLIQSGLAPGEHLVVEGQRELKDGDAIHVEAQ